MEVLKGLKKRTLWTSGYKFNSSELKRVFNFVIKSKQNVWEKKSKVGRKVLEFDYNNKIFRNIVNQELKEKFTNENYFSNRLCGFYWKLIHKEYYKKEY